MYSKTGSRENNWIILRNWQVFGILRETWDYNCNVASNFLKAQEWLNMWNELRKIIIYRMQHLESFQYILFSFLLLSVRHFKLKVIQNTTKHNMSIFMTALSCEILFWFRLFCLLSWYAFNLSRMQNLFIFVSLHTHKSNTSTLHYYYLRNT